MSVTSISIKRLVPTVVMMVIALVLAGCGGGSAAAGAGTKFCANASLLPRFATNGYGSEIAFLRAHQTQINGLRNHAPAAVKADVNTFVTAVDMAIAGNSPSLVNTEAVNRASAEMKTYCGIK
jgi:hypothetical protein